MAEKPPEDKSGLLELLRKLWLPVAGFIGAVTLAYNFYQLWLGDQTTVTYFLAVGGLLVLIIALLWIGFSKKTITHDANKPFDPKRKESVPRYSPQIRRAAWISLGAMFVGVVLGGNSINQRRQAKRLQQQIQATLQVQATQTSYWVQQAQITQDALATQQARETHQAQATQYAQATQHARQEKEAKLIVVITVFEGPEDVYALRNVIVESLNSAFLQDEEIEIIAVNDVITPNMGVSIARNLGVGYFADLVIWGWYRPTENPNITVHIENLSPAQIRTLQESETYEPQATLAQLESFEIQRQLGSETSTLVSFLIGMLKYKSGDYQTAIERFEQVLLQDDISTFVRPFVLFYNLGYSNSQLDKHETALQYYNKAIEIDPENVAAYYSRGIVYYRMGQNDLALQDYNKAIEVDPQFAGAYNGRGLVYYRMGQNDLAFQDYSKAIEIDPENVASYYSRGLVYYRMGQNDLALQDYNKAIQIDPENASAYTGRGVIYFRLRQNDLALQDYDKAIEIDPENAFAYIGRGLIYYRMRQYDLALQDYNKAIEVDPQIAGAYKNRGLTYQELGKTAEAEADFKKYEELTGQKP